MAYELNGQDLPYPGIHLWVHMLGPLNVPIQSEAVIEVSVSEFDSETLQTASDWISAFK